MVICNTFKIHWKRNAYPNRPQAYNLRRNNSVRQCTNCNGQYDFNDVTNLKIPLTTSDLYVHNFVQLPGSQTAEALHRTMLVLSKHTVAAFVSCYVRPRLAPRIVFKCPNSKTAPYSLAYVRGVKLTAACRCYYLSFRNWNRILTIT